MGITKQIAHVDVVRVFNFKVKIESNLSKKIDYTRILRLFFLWPSLKQSSVRKLEDLNE